MTHPRSPSAHHFRAFLHPNFHQKPPSRSSDATKSVLECSPAEFGLSESSEWHRKLPNRHCKSCLKSNSMYSDKTKSPWPSQSQCQIKCRLLWKNKIFMTIDDHDSLCTLIKQVSSRDNYIGSNDSWTSHFGNVHSLSELVVVKTQEAIPPLWQQQHRWKWCVNKSSWTHRELSLTW